MNEMVCELLPEALLESPAQSSCYLHQAAAAAASAAAADRRQRNSSSELFHPASSETAAAPTGRGNGMKVI